MIVIFTLMCGGLCSHSHLIYVILLLPASIPFISSMMKSEYMPGQNCSLSIDGSEHNSVSSISSSPQRRGKWSEEEETYAQAAIRDFNSGHLNAPLGITLRTYLSDKLQCDPMRITKKFTGDASIGKKVI